MGRDRPQLRRDLVLRCTSHEPRRSCRRARGRQTRVFHPHNAEKPYSVPVDPHEGVTRMSLMTKPFGTRAALFGALTALALAAGSAPGPAAAEAVRGYESRFGVRVVYGQDLEADARVPSGTQAPEAAPRAAPPERAGRAPRRSGITIHRAGPAHERNVKVHRGGGTDGAHVIIHRAGIDRAGHGRRSTVRIHRMGEPRGLGLRIHRMGEPRAVNLRIHRAGTWGETRS
jgi:hypothetical protein